MKSALPSPVTLPSTPSVVANDLLNTLHHRGELSGENYETLRALIAQIGAAAAPSPPPSDARTLPPRKRDALAKRIRAAMVATCPTGPLAQGSGFEAVETMFWHGAHVVRAMADGVPLLQHGLHTQLGCIHAWATWRIATGLDLAEAEALAREVRAVVEARCGPMPGWP